MTAAHTHALARGARGLVWVAILAWAASISRGEGRVELTVVTPKGGGLTDSQQWVQAFGQTGIRNVRLRTAQPGDAMGIEAIRQGGDTLYRVTGVMNTRGEIELPGKRFRTSDARGLAAWLNDLAARGLPEEREATSAFGLPVSQFEAVRSDLAQAVPGSTQGRTRTAAVRQIAAALQSPLRGDASQAAALDADTVAEELDGLTCGTALACILRPAGLALVPQAAGDRVELRIVRPAAGQEVWPVGWEPEKPDRDLLPALYEFLNTTVQGVTADQAVEAIAARLEVPALYDHNAIARHGLTPEATVVQLPPGKSTISIMLRKLLFQAGLKHEVRVDEAGKPFLWISSIKPI